MIFGLVSLSAAQGLPPAREMIIAKPGAATLPSSYFIYLGKIVAKKTKSGVSVFNYVDGKIVAEERPDGVVGTYSYDRAGRFEAITYSDGRMLTAIYDVNGIMRGIRENSSGRKAFFGQKMQVPDDSMKEHKTFLQVQEGISALAGKKHAAGADDPVCEEDTPTPCIVEVDGGEGTGGGDEGGLGGGDYTPPDIGDGGGVWGGVGGGDGGGSQTPAPPKPPDSDPQECRRNICLPANKNFDIYCMTFSLPGTLNRHRCLQTSVKHLRLCLDSCNTGDWSWIGDFMAP